MRFLLAFLISSSILGCMHKSEKTSTNLLSCDKGDEEITGCWVQTHCTASISMSGVTPLPPTVWVKNIFKFNSDQSISTEAVKYENSSCIGNPSELNPEPADTVLYSSYILEASITSTEGLDMVVLSTIDNTSGEKLYLGYYLDDQNNIYFSENTLDFHYGGFSFGFSPSEPVSVDFNSYLVRTDGIFTDS